jgi:ectoine hydroxylase-related dioxygenase (phytanoyl-CoA dioxygenase family)
MSNERITTAHIDHYKTHGYTIVENFLCAEELAAAREEIEGYLPGWIGYAESPDGKRPTGWDAPARSRRTARFPFPGSALNAITLHPELLRFAGIMAGGHPLFCEQSDLSFKCTGHQADMDQPMHVDYANHTLAYPPAVPAYWQTTYLLYYTDVDEGSAPTAVCSKTHYPDDLLWPAMHTPGERPELYSHEVLATVPAGSLLAYSVRTYHRGTTFTRESARVAQFISYAPAGCPWVGIVGWSEQAIRSDFRSWIEQATLAERSLLGFPPPGDRYWTDETLAGVSARYPGMDMSPYREK